MKKHIFFQLLFIALTISFFGCKPNDNTPDIESAAIVGKWKMTSMSGHRVLTDDRVVYTFNADGTGSQTLSEDLKSGERAWYMQQRLKYTLNGNALHTQWTSSSVVLEWMASISAISKDHLITDPSRTFLNTTPFEDLGEAEWQRVPQDYNTDIIGLWEGTDCKGITYGDWHHRWLYLPSGDYYYFSQELDEGGQWTGKWIISENALNKYDVDGDYLASRWKETAEAKEDREFWDISINNKNMEWVALRKDSNGNLFDASFSIRRVSPSEEEARQALPGKWIAVEEDGKPIQTNFKSVHTFDGAGTVYYTVADTTQAKEWRNQMELKYSLTNSYLVESGTDNTGKLVQWRSMLAEGTQNEVVIFSFEDNRPLPKDQPYREVKFQRVTVDYRDAIVGKWEGIDGGGDYGDYNHRWEYFADGSYNYFNPDGKGGWVVASSNDGRYMVDGNWMASSWTDTDNPNKLDYEWWDMEIIGDSVMKWVGLRENNERRTFTMKRVKEE